MSKMFNGLCIERREVPDLPILHDMLTLSLVPHRDLGGAEILTASELWRFQLLP